MANPEHLEILKQGVEAWNKWRRENPNVTPDLSDVQLDGMIFTETGVEKGTSFTRSYDLHGVDFSGASLIGVNFGGVRIYDAGFEEANLFGANFSVGVSGTSDSAYGATYGAEMDRADLSGANLNGADFTFAELQNGCWHPLRMPAGDSPQNAEG